MPAPKPADQRVRRVKPATEWRKTEPGGWKHGPRPSPPPTLDENGQRAWARWFHAWWAAWWELEDLPQIELAAVLYGQAMDGNASASAQFRAMAESLGLTPKGRYNLRMLPPDDVVVEAESDELASVRRLRVTDAAG